MLRGWLAADVAPATFHIIDPVAENLPDGVHLDRSSAALDTRFDIVILGIKPQLLTELAPEIARILNPGATLISILAGTTTDTLSGYFPDARVIRLMPNLAAAIGKSPLGVFAPHDDAQQRAEMASLLAPLGAVIWIDEEVHMDAVTALAGSGPAFVYRFIDALSQGGEAGGLPRACASKLGAATTEGGGNMDTTSTERSIKTIARGGQKVSA